MKKKSGVTAEDLLRELNQDPKWLERQRKDAELREQLSEEFSGLEQPILSDLAKVDVFVSTIGDAQAFGHYLPLSKAACAVLLRWLPVAHWRLKEPIVRLLAAPAASYDGTTLTEVFDETLALDLDQMPLQEAIAISNLRWAIGSTIDSAHPHGVSDWVLAKVQDPSLGKSKEMLLLALPHYAPRATAVKILRELFDEFPPQCAKALGKVGEKSEQDFLFAKLQRHDKGTRREIEHAISQISKRLGRT